ncbi:MAG: LURP-one-related/scramblase family protein [Promethearchaeota archaeon]
MDLRKQREFLLQEKLMSFKDKVKVMTPEREELGYFKGKLIKIGNTYRLRDLNDKTLITVHEKVVSMRSTYKFYEGEEENEEKLFGRLKRKLVSVKPNYWFENASEEKIFTMKGNIWALKYKIIKDGKEIAEISKKLFKIKGTYGVKINPDISDDMAMLILGIVVMLHHEKEENR